MICTKIVVFFQCLMQSSTLPMALMWRRWNRRWKSIRERTRPSSWRTELDRWCVSMSYQNQYWFVLVIIDTLWSANCILCSVLVKKPSFIPHYMHNLARLFSANFGFWVLVYKMREKIWNKIFVLSTFSSVMSNFCQSSWSLSERNVKCEAGMPTWKRRR